MTLTRLVAAALALAGPAAADWDDTLAAAQGQTVHWYAWGGDARTNAFIAWVGDEALARYGVTVEQVKLSDTAEAVSRILAEKAAGEDEDGAVDLVWVNGPNFLALREADLLFGPFVEDLPNARLLDLAPGSAASTDFTIPTDGYESPWRLARFILAYDSARVAEPPRSMAALGQWAEAHPGRLTHPDPSNFMGATFLKQALVELAPDPAVLQQAATDETFAAATAPLWAWYDAMRPHLWREGTTFPPNESVQFQLLDDGEVDIAMAFDPAAPAALVEQGLLPGTVRVFVPDGGSLGNVSFVAIPYNAPDAAGAQVVANLLLEPDVQARMQDVGVLGSFSVLDPARLSPDEAAPFDALPSAPALPTLADLGPTLIEPHPSWMTRLADEWRARYAQ